MWGLAWGLHPLPEKPGMPGLPASLTSVSSSLDSYVPSTASSYCFHGNTIAPGVHGPDRGEEDKGLDRKEHMAGRVQVLV